MRVVLAYAGTADDTCAIAWLAARHGAEVITVTLDLGQDRDPGGVRERALSAGARRAHVIDARDEFARDCILPAVRRRAFDASNGAIAHPLIARKLAGVAAIEHADALAHGGSGMALHAAIAGVAGELAVLAPAAEWAADGVDPRAFAREHGIHVPPDAQGDEHRNLIVRRVPARVAAPDSAAHVDLAFDGGVPVAINAVPLALPELIDSLSLIAAQHGIAGAKDVHAPAADVLLAAYSALHGDTGEVRLRFLNGEHAVLAVHDRLSQLVNHA